MQNVCKCNNQGMMTSLSNFFMALTLHFQDANTISGVFRATKIKCQFSGLFTPLTTWITIV